MLGPLVGHPDFEQQLQLFPAKNAIDIPSNLHETKQLTIWLHEGILAQFEDNKKWWFSIAKFNSEVETALCELLGVSPSSAPTFDNNNMLRLLCAEAYFTLAEKPWSEFDSTVSTWGHQPPSSLYKKDLYKHLIHGQKNGLLFSSLTTSRYTWVKDKLPTKLESLDRRSTIPIKRADLAFAVFDLWRGFGEDDDIRPWFNNVTVSQIAQEVSRRQGSNGTYKASFNPLIVAVRAEVDKGSSECLLEAFHPFLEEIISEYGVMSIKILPQDLLAAFKDLSTEQFETCVQTWVCSHLHSEDQICKKGSIRELCSVLCEYVSSSLRGGKPMDDGNILGGCLKSCLEVYGVIAFGDREKLPNLLRQIFSSTTKLASSSTIKQVIGTWACKQIHPRAPGPNAPERPCREDCKQYHRLVFEIVLPDNSDEVNKHFTPLLKKFLLHSGLPSFTRKGGLLKLSQFWQDICSTVVCICSGGTKTWLKDYATGMEEEIERKDEELWETYLTSVKAYGAKTTKEKATEYFKQCLKLLLDEEIYTCIEINNTTSVHKLQFTNEFVEAIDVPKVTLDWFQSMPEMYKMGSISTSIHNTENGRIISLVKWRHACGRMMADQDVKPWPASSAKQQAVLLASRTKMSVADLIVRYDKDTRRLRGPVDYTDGDGSIDTQCTEWFKACLVKRGIQAADWQDFPEDVPPRIKSDFLKALEDSAEETEEEDDSEEESEEGDEEDEVDEDEKDKGDKDEKDKGDKDEDAKDKVFLKLLTDMKDKGDSEEESEEDVEKDKGDKDEKDKGDEDVKDKRVEDEKDKGDEDVKDKRVEDEKDKGDDDKEDDMGDPDEWLRLKTAFYRNMCARIYDAEEEVKPWMVDSSDSEDDNEGPPPRHQVLSLKRAAVCKVDIKEIVEKYVRYPEKHPVAMEIFGRVLEAQEGFMQSIMNYGTMFSCIVY